MPNALAFSNICKHGIRIITLGGYFDIYVETFRTFAEQRMARNIYIYIIIAKILATEHSRGSLNSKLTLVTCQSHANHVKVT